MKESLKSTNAREGKELDLRENADEVVDCIESSSLGNHKEIESYFSEELEEGGLKEKEYGEFIEEDDFERIDQFVKYLIYFSHTQ
jgi:hypothetical protein